MRKKIQKQISIRVTPREFDTILASLRARQGTARTSVQQIEEIANEHGESLTIEEIDDLCQRINGGHERMDAAVCRRAKPLWGNDQAIGGSMEGAKRQPVIVEVNGGVVTNVWNAGEDWAVLDWDNLLGDGADTVNEWNELSPTMQEFVCREYPEDFAKITDAIAKIASANT